MNSCENILLNSVQSQVRSNAYFRRCRVKTCDISDSTGHSCSMQARCVASRQLLNHSVVTAHLGSYRADTVSNFIFQHYHLTFSLTDDDFSSGFHLFTELFYHLVYVVIQDYGTVVRDDRSTTYRTFFFLLHPDQNAEVAEGVRAVQSCCL